MLGFRDVVSTVVSGWARVRGVPYVFEPLGMFRARLRKVGLKRTLDATLYRGVAGSAATVVVSSEREADDVVAGGIARTRVRVRGNGFPDPGSMPPPRGVLRRDLDLPADAPIVLYVGRIASGKGIEHLLGAARALPEIQLVLVGPDDRHGAIDLVRAAQADLRTAGRVHALGATDEPPLHLYREATVLCLPSAGESFGMAAAEAAAAGTPVVVTDRCGIAGFFKEGEALVVPYDEAAVVDALRRVLSDASLPRVAVGRRSRRCAADVVGEGDRSAGGDLPRGDRLAAGVDQRVHRRLVTPCRDELARTGTVAPAEIRIEEPAQRLSRRP